MKRKCPGFWVFIFGHQWRVVVDQKFYRHYKEDTMSHDIRVKNTIVAKCARCGLVIGSEK